MVSKTHYVLSHKASLRKFKESDVISNIFSDNNAMKSANTRNTLQKAQTHGD